MGRVENRGASPRFRGGPPDSNRLTRRALPNEEVVEITRAQRGTSFDPKVVDAFVKVRKDLEVIQREYVGN